MIDIKGKIVECFSDSWNTLQFIMIDIKGILYNCVSRKDKLNNFFDSWNLYVTYALELNGPTKIDENEVLLPSGWQWLPRRIVNASVKKKERSNGYWVLSELVRKGWGEEEPTHKKNFWINLNLKLLKNINTLKILNHVNQEYKFKLSN